MEAETFDAKSALATIQADKKPSRGRKKGSKNNIVVDYPVTTDVERLALMEEIKQIYVAEGYEWLLQENPREKYTTEQLRIHVTNLRAGKRAWKISPNWRDK